MPLNAAQMITGTPYFWGDNPHRSPSVVGTGNVWTDIDTGSPTYTEAWLSSRVGSSIGDLSVADVEPIDIPASATTVYLLIAVNLMPINDLGATGQRFSADLFLPGSDFQQGFSIFAPGEGGGYEILSGVEDEWTVVVVQAYPDDLPGAGQLRDIVTGELATTADVRAMFAGGCHLAFARFSESGDPVVSDYGLRVRDVVASVWWETTRTRQRIVQRDDRARIVRTSSRQNSNRLTGYR